ncbi:hypothetical protein, partial [Salmonella sp. s51228]|uniref:hypothetical protein n=1 Tax=Salmonella sp. s51228 TaxID=3159652 RepID=UPI00397FE338
MKKTSKKKEDEQEEGKERKEKGKLAKLKDKIFGSLIVTILIEYFKDAYNWLDILGMLLIFILIIYRLIN